MHFLLTRPDPECSETSVRLETLGHDVFKAPLLEIDNLMPETLDLSLVDAIVVTSRRVAPLLSQHAQLDALKGLPVFTVGDKSAQSFRELGFEDVTSADGDVSDLLELLREKELLSNLLYLAARDRAGKLEVQLEAAGRKCQLLVAYALEPVAALPKTVQDFIAATDRIVVPVYSKRSAQVLADFLQRGFSTDELQKLAFVAISETVGEVLRPLGDVKVAERPNEEALLGLALRPC